MRKMEEVCGGMLKSDFDENKYVSCIKIHGKPILPPMMSHQRKVEMREYRSMAIEVENRIIARRRESVSSDGINLVETTSTPARPVTLNLKARNREKLTGTLEHRLALDFQSDSEAESEKKRWSPLQVGPVQDLRLQTTCDSESNQDTPDTVTASPRLLRQDSYTILNPKKSLSKNSARNSGCNERTQTSGRSHSGRKTWDLTSAQQSWQASRGVGSDTESELCQITAKSCGSSPRRPNSVPSTERVSWDCADFGSLRDQLTSLSDMMIALTLKHEQQLLELQRLQEAEREQYERIFVSKQRQILDLISSTVRTGSASNSAREPLSCPSNPLEEKKDGQSFRSEPATTVGWASTMREDNSKQSTVVENGKPMKDKQASAADTDFDVSFQDDHSLPLSELPKDLADESETWSLSSRASTISNEPLPASLRNGIHQNYGDNLPLYNKAASILCAGVKGYLTRRLMKTETVRNLRRSLRDSINVWKTLASAQDLSSGDDTFIVSLRRQMSSDWDAVYEIFMLKPVQEQMSMIAADRERLRAQKKLQEGSTGRRLSAATLKTLQRKQLGMSTSLTFPRSPSFKRSCFKMSNSLSGALPSCTSNIRRIFQMRGGGAESSGSFSRCRFPASRDPAFLSVAGRKNIKKKPTARARNVIRNRFDSEAESGPGTGKKLP